MGIEPADGRRGAGERDGSRKGVLLLSGLNHGGAGGDVAVPSGEKAGVSGDLLAERGLVDNVDGILNGNGRDGGVVFRVDGDELVRDGKGALRNAGGQMTVVQEDAFGENREAGAGLKVANLIPFDSNVTDNLAVEDDFVADCADQSASEAIPVGKRDGVESRCVGVGARGGAIERRIGGGATGERQQHQEGGKNEGDARKKRQRMNKITAYKHAQKKLRAEVDQKEQERGGTLSMVQEV